MICDTCAKLRKRHGKRECAALVGKSPVWGPECVAYTDDPDWSTKVQRQVDAYVRRKERR